MAMKRDVESNIKKDMEGRNLETKKADDNELIQFKIRLHKKDLRTLERYSVMKGLKVTQVIRSLVKDFIHKERI